MASSLKVTPLADRPAVFDHIDGCLPMAFQDVTIPSLVRLPVENGRSKTGGSSLGDLVDLSPPDRGVNFSGRPPLLSGVRTPEAYSPCLKAARTTREDDVEVAVVVAWIAAGAAALSPDVDTLIALDLRPALRVRVNMLVIA